MEDLELHFQLALKGREYWIEIKKRYEIDENCYLVICPTNDFLLNKIAMENLNEFLKRKYIKKAIILSTYIGLKEFYTHFSKADVQFQYLDQKQMNCTLKYYKMVQFFPNIVVISLEQPFGNGNIIGKKGITLIDYVRDAIYV